MATDDDGTESSTTTSLAEQRVTTAIADLDASEDRLRALYEALANDPDQHDALRVEIEALQGRRKLLAQEVGLAIGSWLRLGGSVVLTPLAPTPRAVAGVVNAPAGVAAVASEEARIAFAGAVNANGLAGLARQPVTASPLGVLRTLMSALGPPASSRALHDLVAEVERLDHVSDALRDQWALLSRDAQVIWVAMLAARARAVKSVHELPVAARGQLKAMIIRLPSWASQHRPGHIHGLAIDHDPVSASWLDDAFERWAELEVIAAEPAAGPSPAPRPPASSAPEAAPPVPKSEREVQVDASWPLWPFVRGKRALIVGGSPREERRLALEKAFAFDELEWADIEGPRRIDSLAQRVERGSVDLVLLVQTLLSHKDSEKIVDAARSRGTPWALVGGYGVAAVKAGLERFLAAQAPQEVDGQ